MKQKTNILLIGMPGSGKSTVGVILAKMVAKRFLDTDILIQNRQKRTLQDIIDRDGYMVLRKIEEDVLLSIRCINYIIATGGSAPYSARGMEHLKKDSIVVFLHTSMEALNRRIHNYETRGIAKRPDQSFEDLFQERLLLYRKYADITIECSDLTQDQVCEQIISRLLLLQNSVSRSLH